MSRSISFEAMSRVPVVAGDGDWSSGTVMSVGVEGPTLWLDPTPWGCCWWGARHPALLLFAACSCATVSAPSSSVHRLMGAFISPGGAASAMTCGGMGPSAMAGACSESVEVEVAVGGSLWRLRTGGAVKSVWSGSLWSLSAVAGGCGSFGS